MLFTSAAYIQEMHFRLDFIMEVNTMNPDQIAPLAVGVHIVAIFKK